MMTTGAEAESRDVVAGRVAELLALVERTLGSVLPAAARKSAQSSEAMAKGASWAFRIPIRHHLLPVIHVERSG